MQRKITVVLVFLRENTFKCELPKPLPCAKTAESFSHALMIAKVWRILM